MHEQDFRIELFVFPDGTEIEMLVFEKPLERSGHGAGRDEARREPPRRAAAAGASSPAAREAATRGQAEPARTVTPEDVGRHQSRDDDVRGGHGADGEHGADVTGGHGADDAPPPGRKPHVCPVCHSELVYPVDWQRTSDTAWRLRLRCPECETERDAMLGRADVEEYNRHLYYGSQELAQAAQEISRKNFEEEAAKLVAALEMDLILPMDF